MYEHGSDSPAVSEVSFPATKTMSKGNRAEERMWAGLVLTDYYCLTGLCGLVFLVYAQLWIPGLVLIKRDAFQLFLPLKQFVIERLSAGELPQWFPYEGLGRPLISLAVMGVFHPFTALYWLFPVQDAYRVSTLISCLMAASGSFLLCRILGISSAGALIGAVGFSCSGYVMSLTENVLYLYSACTLPLFLFTLEKMLVTQNLVNIALPALVWASVFLNGDIQTGYYYGFLALLWVAMRAHGSLVQAVKKIVFVTSLTMLLSAIQLAPAWESYAHSNRAQSAQFHSEAIFWSTHPFRLITFALSPIGESTEGDRIAQGLFRNGEQGRGPAGFFAESLYLGAPITGLALLGFWRRRDLVSLKVIGAMGILLALGSYGGLYEMFYQWIPLWSAFRYPEKFMGIASCALALVAGGAFDVVRNGRTNPWVWCVVALLFCVLGAWLFNASSMHFVAEKFSIPLDLASHVTFSAAKASVFSVVTALGMAVLTAWINIRPSYRELASIAVVLLIAVDLARANLPAIHTASAETWTFSPALATAIQRDAKVDRPGHFRILSIKDSVANVSRDIDQRLSPRERIAMIRRHGLYLEHNAVFHIESIQNYLAGYSPTVEQIGRNASLRLMARYNVAYFIGRPSRFESPSFNKSRIATVSDYDLALVRNPLPVTPRAYLSPRPEALLSTVPILSFLEREDFLRGDVDGIESDSLPLPGALKDGRATILEYRPETVRVAVEASEPAALVLADAFESGWKARIEGGKDLPIFRVNGLVRAVLVPGGQYDVVFSYATPWLGVGAWLTLLGIAISLFLFAKGGWKKAPAYPYVQNGVSKNDS